MDKISLAGLAISIVAIIGGQYLEGGSNSLADRAWWYPGCCAFAESDPRFQAWNEDGQVGLGSPCY